MPKLYLASSYHPTSTNLYDTTEGQNQIFAPLLALQPSGVPIFPHLFFASWSSSACQALDLGAEYFLLKEICFNFWWCGCWFLYLCFLSMKHNFGCVCIPTTTPSKDCSRKMDSNFKIMIPITTPNFQCSAAFDFTFGFCVCDDIHEVVAGL